MWFRTLGYNTLRIYTCSGTSLNWQTDIVTSHKKSIPIHKQTLSKSMAGGLPIRCFSCGSVLAGKWLKYQELVLKYSEEENSNDDNVGDKKFQVIKADESMLKVRTLEARAMDDLGFKRYCCRCVASCWAQQTHGPCRSFLKKAAGKASRHWYTLYQKPTHTKRTVLRPTATSAMPAGPRPHV